jgi:hypothetical protein
MKPQPSVCVLVAVVAAGALLLGCEGGIQQLSPGSSTTSEIVAAYVDPVSPTPGSQRPLDLGDADKLPLLDGDAQDKEWSLAQPLYVYLTGDQGNGGRNFYAEVRALWSDESRWAGDRNHLYLMVRYNDETTDVLPDYWRYAQHTQFGVVPSPRPDCFAPGCCDSIVVMGANWFRENTPAAEDQLAVMWEITPTSDALGSYGDIGCRVACHGGQFDGPPNGKLDVWVWRAGRTNAQLSTLYPDTTQIHCAGDCPGPDCADGRPASLYPVTEPEGNWTGYMEDMSLDAAGLHQDAADPNFCYHGNGYSGQLYTKNEGLQASADGIVIPRWITEKISTARQGTNAEEVVPVNGGLAPSLYLWGPTAQTFTECDVYATSRASATLKYWSERLAAGDTDVMPGYLLWIPNGGAADVRARGDYTTNTLKRFPVLTVEMRRAMITYHANDVKIDPTQEYTLSIAVFNRSSSVHSGSGPIKIRFQASPWTAAATGGRVNP